MQMRGRSEPGEPRVYEGFGHFRIESVIVVNAEGSGGGSQVELDTLSPSK